jgi:hypothetical protein
LDDGVLADDPSIVFNDFQKIIELSSKIGLSLNYKKCELLIISDNTTIKSNLLNDFSNIAPGISLQEFDNISLLGCPLTNGGISKSIKEKINTFKRFSNCLKFLPSHSAYFLLKNSLSIPRMTYLLRCSPCWRSNDDLIEYDTFLKETLKDICNCSFNENSWLNLLFQYLWEV